MPTAAAPLNLALAWKRLKADHPERVFVRHPFEMLLIEHQLEDWLKETEVRSQHKDWTPAAFPVCEVPKPKGAIRPGSYIPLEDAVVYYSAVGAAFPAIHDQIHWAQNRIDFSYVLSDSAADDLWIKSSFVGWNRFREHSLEQLDEGFQFVVEADITAFYDSIDINTLLSDLRQIQVPKVVVEAIGKCLNKWALITGVPGRGIPQGYRASDILAKLYLGGVDESMERDGHRYCRYVDDIRVFCRTETEAKQVLMKLAALLRKRGLCLQSAKSAILNSSEARAKFNGIAPALLEVNESYIARIIEDIQSSGEDFSFNTDYAPVYLAENFLFQRTQKPTDAPLEVLRQAYDEFFISGRHRFDKTLFHFLINKLGKAGDTYAYQDCLAKLRQYPEETRDILKYIKGLDVSSEFAEFVSEFVSDPDCIYDYQNYLLLEWFNAAETPPPQALVSVSRAIARDQNTPFYLRSVARELLGTHGSVVDLQDLEAAFALARSPIEQCEIIIAMRRLETGRRNSFMARVEGTNELLKRAIKLVKTWEVGRPLAPPANTANNQPKSEVA